MANCPIVGVPFFAAGDAVPREDPRQTGISNNVVCLALVFNSEIEPLTDFGQERDGNEVTGPRE
jgi:hypothetical protein